MNQLVRRLELPITLTMFLGGSAFLLKMCYLSLLFNTVFAFAYLFGFHWYLGARFRLLVPLPFLVLVFAAIEVDAIGNFFQMYGHSFGPLQYDEFSHMTVQILVTPLLVWLAHTGLDRSGYRLPAGLVSFFAATTVFSLSAFYEIIELWDELYFNGHRIWGPHDTANDLQWDLLGLVLGALVAHRFLKRERRVATLVSVERRRRSAPIC
jgi:uncharacterized membrane protein YjdF